MSSRTLRAIGASGLVLAFSLVVVAPASAALMPSRDASAVAGALADPLDPGVLTASSFPVIPPQPPSDTPECADGEDNDFDGFTDFTPPAGETADPGCDSATDNREQDDPAPECANGFDDDFDGFTDFVPPGGETADPGCTSATDNNEVEGEPDPIAACANGDDDDGDGLIDFTPPAGETADPGCASAGDLDEGSEGLPPGADTNPVSVSTTALAGFPTSGSSYGILSSGDSTFADDPNDSGGTGQSNGGDGGTHGATFYDLVTLKLDLTVPAGDNCLALDFRFLSEEFPEYVGSSVNDGFVAELDVSDFTADATNNNAVVAPHNFAFDATGKVVSINTAGFSEADASGTTYDGATPKLRASTPITPGAHAIYLSVFDQGDSILDSAAFVDNLRTFTAPDGTCKAGATDDTTPPDTTITAGPTGTTSDNTPTFEFTSTEANSTFQCRVDGGAWAACTTPHTTTPLANGEHTFEVRAIDPAGNVDPTPATRTFTVDTSTPPDTTPPDTTITAGPSGPTNDSTPTFTFISTEAGSTFQCRIDGGVWAACTTPHTTTPLANGPHTFEVRAIDGSDNVDPTPASRSFTVDSTPPDTMITAGPSGTTTDNTPTFSFTSTEGGSTFQCRIDGGAWAACTTPHTTTPLADGPHTFEVRAIDGSDNVDPTPASRSFTVDSTPPDTMITAGPSGTTTDNTPTFSFTSTEGGSTFQCRIDGGAWTACTTPHTTTPLADGPHTFEARAIDSLGNVDPTPASRAFTVSTPPPTPPIPTCQGKPATIVGTTGDDVLEGTSAKDVIIGLAGNDVINAGGGNDLVCGGDGNDKVNGGGGKDVLDGAAGKDKLGGGGGGDELIGGDTKDRLDGDAGDDSLDGGAGDDNLKGASGDDVLEGKSGDDDLEAGGGDDKLSGDAGDDHLDGGPGRDHGDGGPGQDVVVRCEA